MNKLEMLQHDLEMHTAQREKLAAGEGKSVRLIKRAGHSVEAVIASYDKIIAEIREEISELESKKTARKKPQGKKIPTKTTGKKKPQGKKTVKVSK